jgi:hypothetical protein
MRWKDGADGQKVSYEGVRSWERWEHYGKSETPHKLEALELRLSNISMAVYFTFALVAARTNQRTDAQQSMRLDDFSTSSSTTHTDNHRDLPSSGLGTRAAPIQMNNLGITFIDATPSSGTQSRIESCRQKPFEDQAVQTNPFADPEDPYRGGVGSQESVVQEPEVRQWR